MFTQKYLKARLHYDQETGTFTVVARPGKGVRPGRKLNSIHPNGYQYIQLGARKYMAHRLAWFYVFGEWPSSDLDHKNLKRADNRIANLRLATRSQNKSNCCAYKNNTSGAKGVYLKAGKWTSCIRVNKKLLHLGTFSSKGDAAAAYEKAVVSVRGEFARTA